jgi:hypothetical protein
MTTNNAENRAKAGNAGAVEAVVSAMQGHIDHTGLQRAACFTLSDMATDNVENSAEARNAGAVEAVVAAMRMHREDTELQQAACRHCSSLPSIIRDVRHGRLMLAPSRP